MNNNGTKLNITLTAGGTGGHIFPAVAVAEELVNRGHNVSFITDPRQKQFSFSGSNLVTTYHLNLKSPLGGIKNKIFSLLSILTNIVSAYRHLKKIKPTVVVGFGGYPTLSTIFAAYLLGIKIVLHEQNSVLGRANRLVADIADKICTSFEEVNHVNSKNKSKTVYTGNPVRSEIAYLRKLPYPKLSQDEHLHILVTGGSQGAKIFSEVIPDAIIALPSEVKKRIRLDQQCRQEDIEKVKQKYNDAGINADLATFFVDIAARLASAHILIARSGASTIAEITASGKPSILIPYPHATDDHQKSNASALAKKSAAFVVTQDKLTPEIIAEFIKQFINEPQLLEKTAINAFELGTADAAKLLADAIETV